MSIKTLAARVQYAGGDQIGRMNKQKLKSLQWALKNDYNTRMIKTPNKAAVPCLINTGNLKSDYDTASCRNVANVYRSRAKNK